MSGNNSSPVNLVKTIDIPFIHPQLPLAHLDVNGKLFSDGQIEAIKNNKIIDKLRGKISKKKLNEIFQQEISQGLFKPFEYSLEKYDDNYKVIYTVNGNTHILQDLATGQTTEILQVLKNLSPKKLQDKTEGLKKTRKIKAHPPRDNKENQHELVMELARGFSLNKLLDKKLPTVAWVDLIINVLTAVKELHDAGILHSDLKLENIYYDLLTRKVALVNYDSAAYTDNAQRIIQGITRGHAHGTPANMSPEAERGVNNEKSEIYALALVFAELLDLADANQRYNQAAGKRINVVEVRQRDYDGAENIIKDKNTREAILAMLQKMVEKDNNLTLQLQSDKTNVIDYFKTLRNEYIDVLGLTNRIAYLNIAEYLASNESTRKKMLQALVGIDEVWLIDHAGANQSSYITIQHELISKSIHVSQVVVQSEEDNLDEDMRQYTDQRELSDRNIYDCSYVTKTGQLVNFELALEERHLDKIIASLNLEVIRLQELDRDNSQRRIQLINGTVATLKKAHKQNPVTLDKALRQLDKLQSNMLLDKVSQKNIIDLMHELSAVTDKKNLRSTNAKGFDAVKKHQQTHRNVLQQLNILRPGTGTKTTSPPLPPGYKVPPPIPADYQLSKSAPLLADGVTKPKGPPPIPSALQAELKAMKMPEYQEWSIKKGDYSKFIQIAIAGLQESIEQLNNNKSKQFGNDELFVATSFYMNLIESATTLFQKAIIIHSLLTTKDIKFKDLTRIIVNKISADMDLSDDNSFFTTLKKLCPKQVNTFLHSLERMANSKDPFTFKDKVVLQLKELDPTPENLLVNQPKN
jgi:serine/threonine protein kinase